MYFLYVDESGDIGTDNSPTGYFALSGLVLHELKWHETLEAVIDFRRQLRKRYGLKLREEIHATAFIHRPGDLARIHKSLRLQILRDVLDFQAQLPHVNIINVLVDKSNKNAASDIFEIAWMTLIQRFHNTIDGKNFPGPQNPQDYGVLITDQTDEPKLRTLLRKMRRYNPVPSKFGAGFRPILVTTLVEDPTHRNSAHSYFVQLADVNAFFLYQKHIPCRYVKEKGGKNYFDRLDGVLCKVASRSHPLGIVCR
jgi:hypothetical protein